MSFGSPEFWVALLQIIGVNIVLSGDNAVVIALAARGLPAHQQKKAVAWGSGAAVLMRIVLTIVALELLQLPWLKLVGAVLLLWIAVQLLLPEDEDEDGAGEVTSGLSAAIRTILVADLVMSLDNVIAVAAAAKDNVTLLVIGLAISIPIVIFASQLLMKLMERFPIIITGGAALLGWVAGEMAITDPVVKAWVNTQAPWLHWAGPAAGALIVLAAGKWLAARKAAETGATATAAKPAPSAAAVTGELRVLAATDGSDHSLAALRRLLELRSGMAQPDKVHVDLVNVQRPLPGVVTGYVDPAALHQYRREEFDADLKRARELLDAAGVPYTVHTRIGEPGEQLAALAAELGSNLIVMGSHGMGAAAGALLGSVATDALHRSAVPVLVVK